MKKTPFYTTTVINLLTEDDILRTAFFKIHRYYNGYNHTLVYLHRFPHVISQYLVQRFLDAPQHASNPRKAQKHLYTSCIKELRRMKLIITWSVDQSGKPYSYRLSPYGEEILNTITQQQQKPQS